MSGFILPGRVQCAETKAVRRVGFEIEFAGLELMEVAKVVTGTIAGRIDKQSEAECLVVSDLGEFNVELDWAFGKKLARDRLESRRGEADSSNADDPLMEWITNTAAQLVPVEIVCPPIPMDHLDALNPMIDALRDAGARGTDTSPVYAFGVHINPELPDLAAGTIYNYLLAFCLCQDWLVKVNRVDLSRRLTPYVDLFSSPYIKRLAEQKKWQLAELIEVYAQHNPTRNCALDMTPLFRYLDEPRLSRLIDDDRINARPTLHYRLPNSTPETSGWYLSDPWAPWCVIEQLAGDESQLEELREAWLAWQQKPIKLETPPWFESLTRILQDLDPPPGQP